VTCSVYIIFMGLEVWREIFAKLDGKIVRGSYLYADGVVTVKTPEGTKTNQVGDQTPERLAKMLLRELAREGKA
jgi:hypothetical protein